MNQKQETPTHAVGMNISTEVVSFEIGGAPDEGMEKYVLQPGQKVRLRYGYFHRRRNGNGTAVPSIVDKLSRGAVVPLKADGSPSDRLVWPPGTDRSMRTQPRNIPVYQPPKAAEVAGLDDVASEPVERKKVAR